MVAFIALGQSPQQQEKNGAMRREGGCVIGR